MVVRHKPASGSPKRMDKEYAITGDVKMDIERISDIKKN